MKKKLNVIYIEDISILVVNRYNNYQVKNFKINKTFVF